jgi:cold shock CspA family protein
MSSPKYRWKDEHALVVRDPAIVSLRHSTDLSDLPSVITSSPSKSAANNNSPNKSSSSQHNRNTSNNTNNYAPRETGVIEKLLHSYGFIQCCDRQARLFFHYSEFGGDADTMRTGELVEFQEAADRRTGKPIAVSVVRIPFPKNTFEIISEKSATGLVLAEAKAVRNQGSEGEAPSLMDGMGRVAYEQSGETFFLPFGLEDIETVGQKIQAGDHVEFFISTDEKNGNIRARRMKLVKAAPSVDLYQGVVCALKENYGFIERADVVKEIFFHFSEFQEDIQSLSLGDDVQFAIQTRNSKEVAVNVQKLPLGTVIFEDIGVEKRRGKILKTMKQNSRQGDPLAGRIVYETLEGSIEIPFGERDQLGEYTLNPNDIVEFNIATDRRDKLQRATNIVLSEDTFLISKEKREKGFIATIKDGYGFIRCADREGRMFFHYSELLDSEHDIKLQQEVEFTVVQDPTSASRQVAVRIRYLPKGTIATEQYLPEKYVGTVEKEAGVTHTSMDPESPGIILYDMNGTKQTILFTTSTIEGTSPKLGDRVEFKICECRKNSTKNAVNVCVVGSMMPTAAGREYGYIATLKDGNSGMIESVNREKQVTFQFANVDGDASQLSVGDEVEFTLSDQTASVGAKNIRKLKAGTITLEHEVLPGVLEGKVMRATGANLSEYFGLIQTSAADKGGDEGAGTCYNFGIASLTDKQEVLQKGDTVRFQVAVVQGNGKRYATNVASSRRYLHARVDSIRGQTASIVPDTEDGKKVSFRVGDVLNGGDISVGDEVEYIVMQNGSGRCVAANVRKISERQRPERLISRLKTNSDDSGPRMVVTRQPRGPDGTQGFKQPRKPWKSISST